MHIFHPWWMFLDNTFCHLYHLHGRSLRLGSWSSWSHGGISSLCNRNLWYRQLVERSFRLSSERHHRRDRWRFDLPFYRRFRYQSRLSSSHVTKKRIVTIRCELSTISGSHLLLCRDDRDRCRCKVNNNDQTNQKCCSHDDLKGNGSRCQRSHWGCWSMGKATGG